MSTKQQRIKVTSSLTSLNNQDDKLTTIDIANTKRPLFSNTSVGFQLPPSTAPAPLSRTWSNDINRVGSAGTIALLNQRSKKDRKEDILTKDREVGWDVRATPQVIPQYSADNDANCPRAQVRLKHTYSHYHFDDLESLTY